jgi:hypothetical protein
MNRLRGINDPLRNTRYILLDKHRIAIRQKILAGFSVQRILKRLASGCP